MQKKRTTSEVEKILVLKKQTTIIVGSLSSLHCANCTTHLICWTTADRYTIPVKMRDRGARGFCLCETLVTFASCLHGSISNARRPAGAVGRLVLEERDIVVIGFLLFSRYASVGSIRCRAAVCAMGTSRAGNFFFFSGNRPRSIGSYRKFRLFVEFVDCPQHASSPGSVGSIRGHRISFIAIETMTPRLCGMVGGSIVQKRQFSRQFHPIVLGVLRG